MITERTQNLIACVKAAQAGKTSVLASDLPSPLGWDGVCVDVDGIPCIKPGEGIALHFSVEFIQLCNSTI
ncbi:hypothetical protein D3C87_1442970 [compost metagenome]